MDINNDEISEKNKEYEDDADKEVLEFAYSMSKRNNPDYQLLHQIMKEKDTIRRKFKKKDVSMWLDNPANNEENLRNVHLFLLNQSMFYKRLINYFSTILTFDHILVPLGCNKTKFKSKRFKEDYYSALNFLETVNIKDQFTAIIKTLVGEGIGYYFLRETENDLVFQKMPSKHCKIVGKNNIGYEYAMDMSYFNNKESQLKNYPLEIKRAYERYKKSKNGSAKFQKFNNAVAPVFKFDEDTVVAIPPFIALYYDIFDLFDFKDIIKNRMLLDNWKVLFQRIPMDTNKNANKNANKGSFKFDLKRATYFHNAVKKNLPKGVTVVTSPMEITGVNTERTQGKEGMLNYAENSFYNSAGVSNLLFNSEKTGSIGLKYSIQVDEMFVLGLYRQPERWINYKLKSKTKENKFKVIFPDLTRFNQEEKLDTYLKTAQFGFPKSLVACAMGVTPNEFKWLTDFENAMGLIEELKPLNSSHTATDKKGVGREKKGLNDNPADSTVVGQDNESNDDKAGV